MTSNRIWLAVCMAIGTNLAVLIYMIADRVAILSSTHEIVLKTEPVDPRSLFRGDYVILNYPISRIDGALAVKGQTPERGNWAYVTLSEAGEALSIADTHPGGGALTLRGRVEYSGSGYFQMAYGLEQYFVPEGTGKPLEELQGTEAFQVTVAVGKGGRGAIKAISVRGEVIAVEPLL